MMTALYAGLAVFAVAVVSFVITYDGIANHRHGFLDLNQKLDVKLRGLGLGDLADTLGPFPTVVLAAALAVAALVAGLPALFGGVIGAVGSFILLMVVFS